MKSGDNYFSDTIILLQSGVEVQIQQKPEKIRLFCCGEDEIRTRGQDCTRRRFSKPVVSATHPPLLTIRVFANVVQS